MKSLQRLIFLFTNKNSICGVVFSMLVLRLLSEDRIMFLLMNSKIQVTEFFLEKLKKSEMQNNLITVGSV